MSLKCSVLKSGFCELTQGFGGFNGHRGLDLVDKDYTIGDIVSYGNGTVVMVTNGYGNGQGEDVNWAYGNFVKILHDDGTVCLYAHMEYTSVSYGQRVSKGQFIGRMGNSGNSNGGHLHWEFWSCNDYNANIDPMPYLEPIEPPKPLFTIKKIESKKIQLKIDAYLWDLNFNSYNEAKAIKQFKKGDILEISAIANHSVGSSYYLTEYSYSNKINNGFNVVDCEDYIEPIIKEEPIIEQPIVTEPTTPTEIEDTAPIEQPKQEDNTNTTEIVDKPKKGIIATILGIGGAITYYLQEHWLMLLVVAFVILLVATILYIKKRRNK